MVAFSCWSFDGGEEEKHEMDAARESCWRGKFTKHGRVIQPGVIRLDGKCPLTPLEVGLMLRGMGFNNNTLIYLASERFTRQRIICVHFLKCFLSYKPKTCWHRLKNLLHLRTILPGWLLYIIKCLLSEVFVTTQGGNFPHFLIGHRRFLYGGHSKTIRPNKRKLAVLFDNRRIRWKALKRQLLSMRSQSDAKGIEVKRLNDSIYMYPCPGCVCRPNRSEVIKSLPSQ